MKYLAVFCILLAFIFGTIALSGASAKRCATNEPKGFAYVRGDQRIGGTGAIPSQFTGDPRFFGIRYNCTRKGVQVRRVDTGVYEILFPDNPSTVINVTSGEGLVAGVDRLSSGSYRIIIRSPIIENGVLQTRESTFYVVLF